MYVNTVILHTVSTSSTLMIIYCCTINWSYKQVLFQELVNQRVSHNISPNHLYEHFRPC